MFKNQYREAFILCKLKTETDASVPELPVSRIVLDVPFRVINRQVVSNGQNFYGGPIPVSCDGQEALAHVVYPAEDDAAVQAFPGLISGPVMTHPKYATHWPQTVGDVETARLRAALPDDYEGELPVYDGPDAGDPYPFCVFAEDGYEDR